MVEHVVREFGPDRRLLAAILGPGHLFSADECLKHAETTQVVDARTGVGEAVVARIGNVHEECVLELVEQAVAPFRCDGLVVLGDEHHRRLLNHRLRRARSDRDVGVDDIFCRRTARRATPGRVPGDRNPVEVTHRAELGMGSERIKTVEDVEDILVLRSTAERARGLSGDAALEMVGGDRDEPPRGDMAEVERRRLTEPSEAVAEHQHRKRLLVVDDQCIPIRRGVELAGEFVGNEHLEFLREDRERIEDLRLGVEFRNRRVIDVGETVAEVEGCDADAVRPAFGEHHGFGRTGRGRRCVGRWDGGIGRGGGRRCGRRCCCRCRGGGLVGIPTPATGGDECKGGQDETGAHPAMVPSAPYHPQDGRCRTSIGIRRDPSTRRRLRLLH